MHWSTGMTTSADAVCLTELLLSNYHRCSDRSTTFGFWLFRIWEYEPQIDELRPFRKKWAPKLPGSPDVGSLRIGFQLSLENSRFRLTRSHSANRQSARLISAYTGDPGPRPTPGRPNRTREELDRGVRR